MSQAGQKQWFYNSQSKLWYYYEPQTDEFVFEDGRTARRPENISRESLLSAQPRQIPLRALTTPQSYTTLTNYTYGHSTQHTATQSTQNYTQTSPTMAEHPPSSNTLATSLAALNLDEDRHRHSANSVQVTQNHPTTHGQQYDTYNTMGQIRIDAQEAEDEDERLRKSFRRRKKPKDFFVEGKVFLTLWTEPAGDTVQNTGSGYTPVTSGISTGVYGEPVHSRIRRFVVVRAGTRHCGAIPIMTYHRKGVAKLGVNKSEHAIIYSGRIRPDPRPDELPRRQERGMLPGAIRVDADINEEKLDPMSRVDFSKVYTIEHNVKVKSFGMVNRDSVQALRSHFASIWSTATVAQPAAKASSSHLAPTGQTTGVSWEAAYQRLREAGYTDEQARSVLRDRRF